MLEILGTKYYIDVDKVIEQCRPVYYPPVEEDIKEPLKEELNSNDNESYKYPQGGLELNVFKFEVFKSCIEKILNEYEEVDESLGQFASGSTSISFRIAYNTLIKYKILIESEDE